MGKPSLHVVISDWLFLDYPKCGEDQFTCGNFRCIGKAMRCNGVDNCRDGVRSDELDCRKC